VILFIISGSDVFADTPTAAQLAETQKVQSWISFLNSLMA